jgi:hypothetical protein
MTQRSLVQIHPRDERKTRSEGVPSDRHPFPLGADEASLIPV